MKISKAMLEERIKCLNHEAGVGNKPYTKIADGFKANAGVHTLAGSYGGHCIERMSEGGGCSILCNTGYVTKRELWVILNAYLEGYTEAKKAS